MGEVMNLDTNYKLRTKLKYFLLSATSLFYNSYSFAVNQFTDTPLHLQSQTIQTTGYRVKPNITFFIDNSGSMSLTVDAICDYRIRTCVQKRGRNCKRWDNPPWEPQNRGSRHSLESINTSLPSDEPPQNIKWVDLKRCQYISRMDAVNNVLEKIVRTYRNDFYFSLIPFNQITWGMDHFFDTSKGEDFNTVLRIISRLYPNGGTPTFRRLNVAARNTVINRLKYRCQKSYLIILSDGAPYDSYYPNTDSTRRGYDGYFDGNTVRDNKIFRTTHGIAYFTDTLRTKNFGPYIYNKDFWHYNGLNVNGDKSKVRRWTDDAGQPWDGPDPLAHLPGHSPRFTQTAQTFTISFGLKNDSDRLAIELLRNGASPKPDYHPVTNPYSRYFYNTMQTDEVLKAFENIFKEITAQTNEQKATITTTTPIMGESTTSNNDLLIKSRIDTEHWSSQLCFHSNNENAADKGACNKKPSFSNRKLVLNDGNQSYLASGNHFGGLNNDSFKVANNNNQNNMEWRDGLLSWFSRSKLDHQIKQNGFVLDYRQRPNKSGFGDTRNMGDILNNPIETIGQTEFNKRKYLITSANDGMVYVFRAANSNTNPYDLKFNYMPMAIEREGTNGSDLVGHYYKDLTNNLYGKDTNHPHRYLLNGGFTVVETPPLPNKPQQIFMVSNMGQAGRGAFALNIGGKSLTTGKSIAADNMQNANWYHELFLFQTPSGFNNQFGYTIGTPAVAITRVNREQNAARDTYNTHLRELAFINNGVNFPNQETHENESALYIYDVLGVDVGTESYQVTGDAKGHLVRKLTAPNGNGGLASPVVYDIDNDGVADLVYAGDYGGNLYRFDIRDPHPDNWTVNKIFTADGPITTAPVLFEAAHDDKDPNAAHKVIVVFGTGSDLYQSDLQSKKQQAIYGIYDDYEQKTVSPVNKGELLQQTMSYSNNTGQLSSLPFSSAKYKGWYFRLNTDGERVTTAFSQLLSTGMVITRSYDLQKKNGNQGSSSDPCQVKLSSQSTNIQSRITQFDSRNGGKVDKNNPHFILGQNKNAIQSSYKINGFIGLIITGMNYYNPLNAGKSGQQKIPGSIMPKENCLRVKPSAHLSSGDNIGLGGIPMCPIEFKRIGWREIKETFN